MRSAACIALLATLTTACTLPRSTRAVAVVSGAAISLTGMALVADRDVAVDSDGNGVNDTPFNDNWDDLDDKLAGVALVGLGLALIVAGATAREPVEGHAAPLAPSWQPTTVTWAPGLVRATLPEIATDAVVLRMAQQARAAVERGECDAAWSTWGAIDARDPRYAAALASGPVLAPCLRPVASLEPRDGR